MRRVVLAILLVLGSALPAPAHEEREVAFPSGNGAVPEFRTDGPSVVVCKKDSLDRSADLPDALRRRNKRLFERCRFRNIQAAVDAVAKRGTRIMVMPGVYREKPSRRPPSDSCARLNIDEPLSYAQQVRCPHRENLIAIFGDSDDNGIACDGPRCQLQIQGTGADPTDVILDAGFSKENVLRADRADGIYMRNFTVQRNSFNGIYVLQTDGFVIDDVVGRWSDEYGFLTFASDHGLYTDCEAYGNGDSGLYPGGVPPQFGDRFSIEITGCSSHNNLLGYSGTGGNSVHVHDNDFFNNTTGISMDSLFPSHPGLPQGYSVFENNRVYSNNEDYYRFYRDGTCVLPSAERGYEDGAVCPTFGAPVGVGILVAGGNHNVFATNDIYDNWKYGTMQLWVPAWIRGEFDPALEHDTSNFNRYDSNSMGFGPTEQALPNGIDFWWDEEGEGNCWTGNVSSTGEILSDPGVLPGCEPPPPFTDVNSEKFDQLVACSAWSEENYDPPDCDWFRQPPPPTR